MYQRLKIHIWLDWAVTEEPSFLVRSRFPGYRLFPDLPRLPAMSRMANVVAWLVRVSLQPDPHPDVISNHHMCFLPSFSIIVYRSYIYIFIYILRARTVARDPRESAKFESRSVGVHSRILYESRRNCARFRTDKGRRTEGIYYPYKNKVYD